MNITMLDRLVYVAAIFAPIMTMPQIYDIWIKGNIAGVSLITWGSYLLFATIWLIYGLIHRDKPIILSNTLWIIADVLVVKGILA